MPEQDDYSLRLRTDIFDAVKQAAATPGVADKRAFALGWLMSCARLSTAEMDTLTDLLRGGA